MQRNKAWPAGGLGGVYVLLYLIAIGDIDIGPAAWDWYRVPQPLERLTAMRGAFHFEAVALAELGYAVFLISPGNLLIAGLLGLLLAVNVHGALDLRQSATCGLPQRVGWTAGTFPALLAGGACCAPGLLLLIGIPGLGAFVGLFAWLVPLSIILLAASRYWQRRQGARPVLVFV